MSNESDYANEGFAEAIKKFERPVDLERDRGSNQVSFYITAELLILLLGTNQFRLG